MTKQEIIDTISSFEDHCNEHEYTDTGLVWEIFYEIRDALVADLAGEIGEGE